MPLRKVTLVLVGLVLLALNLRPAAVSVGPVLTELREGLGMSVLLVGLLTSLPVLAFAGFGALAPWLAHRFGLHRMLMTSIAVLALGLGGRALVSDDYTFLGLTMAALGGMAVANVLIPSLVKLHFPERIGQVTALYTGMLAIGLTGAITLTVPISHAFGSWRAGLGTWAVMALVALLPWLMLIANDRHLETAPRSIGYFDVAKTRLGWAMACFFGLQSLQAYSIFGWFAELWRDHGYSAAHAGLLVGVISGFSIPLTFWLPNVAARTSRLAPLLWGIIACYVVGYTGLLIAPYSLAILWALIIGVGTVTFPLVLTLVGLRARTSTGTAALSGFTQSAGYLMAAVGPFSVGAAYDATGGWTWPLLILIGLSLPMFGVAAYVSGERYIEDQLPGVEPTSVTRR